jgi:hypothetical protein
MPTAVESLARTRAIARVLGPFLAIVPTVIAFRAPDMGEIARAFFQNSALVWITGGFLVFGGLAIIAFHQYWSSAAAVIISVFGWILLLRGLVLLAAPQLYEQVTNASVGSMTLIRAAFAVLILCGLWLTYTGWKPQRTA